jgi:hypothetical protein
MTANPTLFAELEHAIALGPADRRADIVLRVATLFAGGSDHFSDDAIGLFDDIIKQMHYRVYTVGNNGHFVSARDIEAPHDESAVLNAQKFIDGLDVEVWQAGRFVERIVAERRAWSRRSAGRR